VPDVAIASFHPEVTVAGDSTRVLCEMVGVADARGARGSRRAPACEELLNVDDALRLVLDLL
jgi:hypothetical protein